MYKESQQKILVFLIEENQIDRQGAYSMISKQQGMEVLGQASSVEEVLQIAGDILPRTVVVYSMLTERSLSMVYRLRKISPEVSVIVLAEYEDDDNLSQAIMAGASAFLTKQSTNEQLFSVIKRVFKGERPVCQCILHRPRVAMQILERFHKLSSMALGLESLVAPLSVSENDVLSRIADGNPIEAITGSLNVSKREIERYVSSILRKLDVNERTRNAIVALRGRGSYTVRSWQHQA